MNIKKLGMMVRNLFRKWLVEWIEENMNSDWNVIKQVIEKKCSEQSLDVNVEKYEVLRQFSRIFGDVRKLQNVNNNPSEQSQGSIWNFFSLILGYSRHDTDQEVEQDLEKQIDDIKITMFGSEISQLYHQMINPQGNRYKYLVGCDLSIIDYHSLRSLTRYRYQIFAHAGSDKFIGIPKSYFRGSHFVVLLFDSKDELEYFLCLGESRLNLYMELIFVQMKSSQRKQVEKHVVEQFIYSNFGEAVYLEIDIENNPKSGDALLAYTTLLSDILMGCNLHNKNYKNYEKNQ